MEFGGSEYEVVSDFAASLTVVGAKIALNLAVFGLARLPTRPNIANIELDHHDPRLSNNNNRTCFSVAIMSNT